MDDDTRAIRREIFVGDEGRPRAICPIEGQHMDCVGPGIIAMRQPAAVAQQRSMIDQSGAGVRKTIHRSEARSSRLQSPLPVVAAREQDRMRR
ncbi:hypothetical protein [Sphingomonas nostoxanthinifaciens]|uniref:hypothetical protein n=1 Tax=Sphingomonas nostoxanthinifaciens TaxID=2872652 RepID=UPI001CC1EE95|nr:hypothetical protein [Sphingomonas nostoxanthinifaciens]